MKYFLIPILMCVAMGATASEYRVVNKFSNTTSATQERIENIEALAEQERKKYEELSRLVASLGPDDTDVSEYFKSSNTKNSKWTYKTSKDVVERTTATEATIKSNNAYNLGIGQGGNQSLYITIYNEHDTGFYNDEIFIGYMEGLVEVCFGSCYMRARFDDEDEASWYRLDHLSSHHYKITGVNDEKMFDGKKLKNDDYFLLKLHNSKSLVLKFPNFNGQTYTYAFDLKGLDAKKLGPK